MLKYLNIPNGDYYLKTQSDGTITLDTGLDSGSVIITGNLEVRGNTTTINTADLTVEDNIIVVNSGETGAGITLGEAGLRVDRGDEPDTFFVYNESLNQFVFKESSGSLVGLRVNTITTGGGDLSLIGSGNGVISVAGTSDYENSVSDDDDIPNKKYVDQAIVDSFLVVNSPKIGDGTPPSESSVEVRDFENTGDPSVINFSIDGTIVSQLFDNRWEFDEIQVIGTTVETTTTDSDLILKANGTGSVRVDDILYINNDPATTPSAPSQGVNVYVSDQYTGKTGIYFVNKRGTRDELISKNRALLFSMLF